MVVRINPPTNESIEMMSCQTGTLPEGMRAIITIGEEKGIILAQTAKEESGFPAAISCHIHSLSGILHTL